MEFLKKFYAIRDALFWWMGVWACMTLGNRIIRKMSQRSNRAEYEQRLQDFMDFLKNEDEWGAAYATES